MPREILITSVPRGIKPGRSGFQIAMQTAGLRQDVAATLETMAGYRHLPAGNGPNPVCLFHRIVKTVAGTFHVLGRTVDAGVDFSNRSNKLCHMVVIEQAELGLISGSSPAAVLAAIEDRLASSWTSGPEERKAEFNLGGMPLVSPAPCRTWQQRAGDAGWAGVFAERAMQNQPTLLIGRDPSPASCREMLRMFQEALAIMPPHKRWGVAFDTLSLSSDRLIWRGTYAGSPESSTRQPGLLVLDLSRPQPIPADYSGRGLVQDARAGTTAGGGITAGAALTRPFPPSGRPEVAGGTAGVAVTPPVPPSGMPGLPIRLDGVPGDGTLGGRGARPFPPPGDTAPRPPAVDESRWPPPSPNPASQIIPLIIALLLAFVLLAGGGIGAYLWSRQAGGDKNPAKVAQRNARRQPPEDRKKDQPQQRPEVPPQVQPQGQSHEHDARDPWQILADYRNTNGKSDRPTQDSWAAPWGEKPPEAWIPFMNSLLVAGSDGNENVESTRNIVNNICELVRLLSEPQLQDKQKADSFIKRLKKPPISFPVPDVPETLAGIPAAISLLWNLKQQSPEQFPQTREQLVAWLEAATHLARYTFAEDQGQLDRAGLAEQDYATLKATLTAPHDPKEARTFKDFKEGIVTKSEILRNDFNLASFQAIITSPTDEMLFKRMIGDRVDHASRQLMLDKPFSDTEDAGKEQTLFTFASPGAGSQLSLELPRDSSYKLESTQACWTCNIGGTPSQIFVSDDHFGFQPFQDNIPQDFLHTPFVLTVNASVSEPENAGTPRSRPYIWFTLAEPVKKSFKAGNETLLTLVTNDDGRTELPVRELDEGVWKLLKDSEPAVELATPEAMKSKMDPRLTVEPGEKEHHYVIQWTADLGEHYGPAVLRQRLSVRYDASKRCIVVNREGRNWENEPVRWGKFSDLSDLVVLGVKGEAAENRISWAEPHDGKQCNLASVVLDVINFDSPKLIKERPGNANDKWTAKRVKDEILLSWNYEAHKIKARQRKKEPDKKKDVKLQMWTIPEWKSASKCMLKSQIDEEIVGKLTIDQDFSRSNPRPVLPEWPGSPPRDEDFNRDDGDDEAAKTAYQQAKAEYDRKTGEHKDAKQKLDDWEEGRKDFIVRNDEYLRLLSNNEAASLEIRVTAHFLRQLDGMLLAKLHRQELEEAFKKVPLASLFSLTFRKRWQFAGPPGELTTVLAEISPALIAALETSPPPAEAAADAAAATGGDSAVNAVSTETPNGDQPE